MDRTRKWILDQIRLFGENTAKAPALPFSGLLSAKVVEPILEQLPCKFRDRVYSPLVTLWVFLSQVFSEDHSCREAVARLMAFRIAQGKQPCSPDTNPYCQARQRLPEPLFEQLVRRTGRALAEATPAAWRWLGRRVKVVDGTTVSMPDTAANQAVYPQPRSQAPGVGFPLARMVVVFCLACGAALEMAIGPYRGKQTGEGALFRTLWDQLDAQDVVLADRYYCSYVDIAMLGQRQVDVVFRKHQRRHSDFRRGERLGEHDHLIMWTKPIQRPEWMDKTTFQQIPEQLTLREIQFTISQPGRRVRKVILITTLLDAETYPRDDLAHLYGIRWQAEIDLRSLKTVMQMDVLRTKKPATVRKEIWTHLLAYNLIRTVIAQAADAHGRQPTQISFKGALQTINAFREYLLSGPVTEHCLRALLAAIVHHRIGHRPNRYEPRARKRRPKPYKLLQMPRQQARKRLPGKTYD